MMQIMATSSGNDRQSRRELLETIEQQKEEISKYKKRLGDVVHAYKGLVKEKEALENSLSILNTSTSKPSDKTDENPEEGEAQDDTENSDKDKRISTLTASLATVTSEKSRIEASFQEDKKKLRAELNEKDSVISNLKQEVKQFRDKFKTEIDEAKSKLIIERHNREKETNDHALMLRELQKLVTDERSAKEKADHELQQVKDQLKGTKMSTKQWPNFVNLPPHFFDKNFVKAMFFTNTVLIITIKCNHDFSGEIIIFSVKSTQRF